MHTFHWTALAIALGLCSGQGAELPAPASHQVDFAKEIQPILEVSCVKCHGRGHDKRGFVLDTRESLLAGGDSGPVVVPGKSKEAC